MIMGYIRWGSGLIMADWEISWGSGVGIVVAPALLPYGTFFSLIIVGLFLFTGSWSPQGFASSLFSSSYWLKLSVSVRDLLSPACISAVWSLLTGGRASIFYYTASYLVFHLAMCVFMYWTSLRGLVVFISSTEMSFQRLSCSWRQGSKSFILKSRLANCFGVSPIHLM